MASEIKAVTGKSPSELYAELTAEHGAPAYARIDAPANREQKAKLSKLDASSVTATELAGEPITAILTAAPGNDAPIGGLKVATESAWFAARPSGTEDVYKIYAESFKGPEHLAEVQDAARAVVSAALGASRREAGLASASCTALRGSPLACCERRQSRPTIGGAMSDMPASGASNQTQSAMCEQ